MRKASQTTEQHPKLHFKDIAMTMHSIKAALVVTMSITATVAAAADANQPSATEQTLDWLAAVKFNQDTVPSDFQTVMASRETPYNAAADGWAAAHFTHNPGSEYAQGLVASAVPGPARSDRAQLIAAAGLAESAGLTLDAIAAAKFSREDAN